MALRKGRSLASKGMCVAFFLRPDFELENKFSRLRSEIT